MGHDKWRFIAIATMIVVLALVLRVYQIGTQELWLDEAVSFRITYLDSGLDHVLMSQNSPPLYYLLLRAWVRFAGDGEAAIRSLSMVFGTLFVVAIISLGRMAFHRTVGLWSGLFAAVNPIHIYYSQEARAYSLVMFLVALTYTVLWRALQTNSWRAWTTFAACALLALYTHYMAVLALAPTAFLVLVWQGPPAKSQRWRNYGVAVLLCVVLFAPWALLRFSTNSVAGIDWIQDAWNYAPTLKIPTSLEVFGLGSEKGLLYIHLKQYFSVVFPAGLRLLGLSILVFLLGSFLLPWGDRALNIPWIEKRKAWLLTLLFFPLIILWGVSFFRPFYVVARYDMIAFPAFPLALGLGITKIGNLKQSGPFLATMLAVVFFGVVGAKLFAYYHAANPLANARATAALLDNNVANGDVVVFTRLGGAPILYYLYRRGYEWEGGACEDPLRGRVFGCRMFPRETEQNVGVYAEQRVLDSLLEAQRDVRSFTDQLDGPNNSLWIVFESIEYSPEHGFAVPAAETRMVRELQAVGFRPELVDEQIFRFTRELSR